MQKQKSKGSKSKKILILLLVILLAVFGNLMLRNKAFTDKDWIGVWKVAYFYDNDPKMIYKGSLHLSFRDSLKRIPGSVSAHK